MFLYISICIFTFFCENCVCVCVRACYIQYINYPRLITYMIVLYILTWHFLQVNSLNYNILNLHFKDKSLLVVYKIKHLKNVVKTLESKGALLPSMQGNFFCQPVQNIYYTHQLQRTNTNFKVIFYYNRCNSILAMQEFFSFKFLLV